MKPFVKICIALSAVLFLLGITGVIIGSAMGVTPSQILYAGRPGRFTLRPKTEDSSWPAPGFPGSLEEPEDGELADLPPLSGDNPTDSEEYYEFRDIENIEMDLSLCELHVLPHAEDYIAVCADNVRYDFRCLQEDDTLILEDTRTVPFTGNSMDQALRLDLYLPEQNYEDFSLDLGTGNITLDRLAADYVEIDHGVGAITIESLSCRELDVDIGTCEFLAESILASQEADINAGAGTITIHNYDGADLVLDCGTGDVKITAAGNESDYNYKLNAALGDVYLNHHRQEHHQSHHGSHHNNDYCVDIHHGANRDIEILCALGNAELNFTEE